MTPAGPSLASGGQIAPIGALDNNPFGLRLHLHAPRQQRPPSVFDWFKAIGTSSLDAGEKNVARTLLTWADLKTGGNIFPTIGTVARFTSQTKNGVRGILRRLERKGVITYDRWATGARDAEGVSTNRMRLNFEALCSLHVPDAGRKQVVRGASTKLRGRTTSGASPPLNNVDPNHPTNTSQAEQAKRTTQLRKRDVEAPAEQPDGSFRVRQCLLAAGVAGRNLERLAQAPGITLELVSRHRQEIAQDERVRNPTAVLVRRLSDELNIPLKGSMSIGACVTQEVERVCHANQHLHAKRKALGG